ncbi:MAG: DUF427 domain-containing protein [Actinomycetota bacterium]
MAEGLKIEPTPRRVRACFGGIAVADSSRVLLVWEPRRLPVYWFPTTDVRMDLLRPAPHAGGSPARVQRYNLGVGGRRAEKVAWAELPDVAGADPPPGEGPAARGQLRDHVAFMWDMMDAWFEEDEEVFVHPRDPYHRVDVVHSSRQVRVEAAGRILAQSGRPSLLFETGLPTRYYLPKLDVRMDLLTASRTTSRCPYKGVAVYWSVPGGGGEGDRLLEDLAWSYPLPIPECPKIENLICFYNEKLDIFVDGVLQARPATEWSPRPDRAGGAR